MFRIRVSIFKMNGTIRRFHETYEAKTLAEIDAHVEFLNRTARFWETGNTYSWYHQEQPTFVEPPAK